MADEKTGGPRGLLVGWFKALGTSVVGLVGGACLMYFSPLIDKVIKPGKPLANFQAESDGLKVVFHNRSSNGNDGWWDFGDGSALEPYQSGQDVNHAYTHPGTYSVKLTLRSLFGEVNERAVTVALDGPTASTNPVIDTFEAESLNKPVAYAPATFKVTSKVKNADLCVWALGGDHPIDVAPDTSGTQEHYVTFRHPGTYVLKLAAYSASTKQIIEKAQTIVVERPPRDVVLAVLNVTHHVIHVTTHEVKRPVVVDFPPGHKGDSFKFQREIPTRPGFVIVKAHLDGEAAKYANVRGLALEILPDRQKVRLSGELLNTAGGHTGWTAPLVLTVEQRGHQGTKAMSPVAVPVAVPGNTVLPMPMPQGGWTSQGHSLTLEMRDGDRPPFWQAAQLPQNSDFILRNQRYRLIATEASNQVRITVTPLGPGGAPVGN
jgi:PKD repeat protein